MNFIPYGRQWIDDEDINAVIAALKSDWLTQGPAIEGFERAISEYCGVEYAVAVSSGTAALHIACLASGLGAGDMLWTSPNTFVASANCALYSDARPDFVDIDPLTYNMDVGALEDKLKASGGEGGLPKIVIPVHFAGLSCDMERIRALSREYKFIVIEDACHALGGVYGGKRIGSCEHSDMCVFSFHAVKAITTGEGGMITTNSEALYRTLVRLRTHGITRDPRFMGSVPEGAWYYEQVDLGLNYRMTDIQAALGTSQLRRLDKFVARRSELADRYDQRLSMFPLSLPARISGTNSAWHLYVVRLDTEKMNKTRGEVFDALKRRGIGVNVHYIPVHTQPYFRGLGFRKGQFPEAERYYEEALTLPLYPLMSDSEQDFVVSQLKEVIA